MHRLWYRGVLDVRGLVHLGGAEVGILLGRQKTLCQETKTDNLTLFMDVRVRVLAGEKIWYQMIWQEFDY